MNTWHRANTVSLSAIITLTAIIGVFIGINKMKTSPNNPIAHADIEDAPPKDTVLQYATETSKDIWINKNGSRYHYHLEAPKSRFVMKNTLLGSEIIEEMEDMRLWMQDKVINIPKPMQEVRFIKAPKSYFLFTQHALKTEDAFMALYSTPGRELSLYLKPEQITLRGHAKTFDILMEKGGVKFAAKDFNAQLHEIKE